MKSESVASTSVKAPTKTSKHRAKIPKMPGRSNPNLLIKAEIAFKKSFKVKPQVTPEITKDHIQSFMNGVSRGFCNGLEIALEFVQRHVGTGYTVPELAIALETFTKESIYEQQKNKSS